MLTVLLNKFVYSFSSFSLFQKQAFLSRNFMNFQRDTQGYLNFSEEEGLKGTVVNREYDQPYSIHGSTFLILIEEKIVVLSYSSKILNNEQIDNGITLKSKTDNEEKLFIF